jgi:hypothetical protein
MEARRSSETSALTRATRHHILEDGVILSQPPRNPQALHFSTESRISEMSAFRHRTVESRRLHSCHGTWIAEICLSGAGNLSVSSLNCVLDTGRVTVCSNQSEHFVSCGLLQCEVYVFVDSRQLELCVSPILIFSNAVYHLQIALVCTIQFSQQPPIVFPSCYGLVPTELKMPHLFVRANIEFLD